MNLNLSVRTAGIGACFARPKPGRKLEQPIFIGVRTARTGATSVREPTDATRMTPLSLGDGDATWVVVTPHGSR